MRAQDIITLALEGNHKSVACKDLIWAGDAQTLFYIHDKTREIEPIFVNLPGFSIYLNHRTRSPWLFGASKGSTAPATYKRNNAILDVFTDVRHDIKECGKPMLVSGASIMEYGIPLHYTNGVICYPTGGSKLIDVANRANPWSIAEAILDKLLLPRTERQSYWQMQMEYVCSVIGYEFAVAGRNAQDKVHALIHSNIATGFMQVLEDIRSMAHSGEYTRVGETAKAMSDASYELYRACSSLASAYKEPWSKGDYGSHSRTPVALRQLAFPINCNDEWHDEHAAFPRIYFDRPQAEYFWGFWEPLALLSNWDRFQTDFDTVTGISPIKPFGMDFCRENLPAFAALFPEALEGIKNPREWFTTYTKSKTQTQQDNEPQFA